MRWVLLVIAGCAAGGPPPGEATVTGTIASLPFTVASVMSAPATNETYPTTMVALASFADGCSVIAANPTPASSQQLDIQLLVFDSSGHASRATSPGNYAVLTREDPPAGDYAMIGFTALDAMCHEVTSATGVSGTVDVSALDAADAGTEVAGSFEFDMDAGDHLSGAFSTIACPALAAPPPVDVPCH